MNTFPSKHVGFFSGHPRANRIDIHVVGFMPQIGEQLLPARPRQIAWVMGREGGWAVRSVQVLGSFRDSRCNGHGRQQVAGSQPKLESPNVTAGKRECRCFLLIEMFIRFSFVGDFGAGPVISPATSRHHLQQKRLALRTQFRKPTSLKQNNTRNVSIVLLTYTRKRRRKGKENKRVKLKQN